MATRSHTQAPEACLTVTEIFKSIQGESTWAGVPCTFVRLTGCNLRCTYCDTTYAYEGGTPMTCGEIVARCDALGCEVVEVTGGEPLCQPECAGLVTCLLEKGYTVLVETNGSVPIVPLPSGAIRIMDLKCPGSGMAEKNDWTNIQALGTRDEIKFVISDRSDYEWARGIVAEHGLCERCNAVLFSPVFGVLDASSLASWIVEDGLKVRLQIQLHKCIWPHEQRGV